MAESYDVSVKVLSQKGTCDAGHKVGDEWIISNKTPEGICPVAYNTLYPFAFALMFGGSFPWDTGPDMTTVACPDAQNPVVFEVRRLWK